VALFVSRLLSLGERRLEQLQETSYLGLTS
jgi:hypothetical protein